MSRSDPPVSPPVSAIGSAPLTLIDAHMLGRRETGNETYISGLLRGLLEIGRPQAVAVSPDLTPAAPGRANATAMAGRPAGADLECLRGHRVVALPSDSDARRLLRDLPRLARELDAQVLHCTYFPPPVPPCPTVVTVHDVSFLRHPEWFTARDRAVLNAGVRLAARRAARIIVPSQHARAELAELLDIAPDRVVVTPEGAAAGFIPAPEALVREVLGRHGLSEPYVLSVGNLQPRKNLRRLLQAWRDLVRAGAHCDARLVLIGGVHGRAEALADLLADPALAATVELCGYVPHEELPALYSGAQAFVFPSLYEGFGLPALEAMACGAPVACAATASLPEVVGDAAALFDPRDVGDIAATLATLLADARLRARLRERGLERARSFSWAACATATVAAYEAAAEGPPRPSSVSVEAIPGPAAANGVAPDPASPDTAAGRPDAPTAAPLRIALIGTRGVPAAYSGFETAVENLGRRLAARGHDVVVYCRPHMVEGRYATYKGMRLVYLPTITSKHLDTFVHTFLSTLHMGFRGRRDVAIYFIAGNAPFAALSRLLGIPSAINVDGLDSRRAKWGGAARRYIRWTEHNAQRLANSVVTDSRVLQRIYRDEHGAETLFIPYGAEMAPVADAAERLSRLGLRTNAYVLFVGRLVPENNAHVLVEAFGQLARQGRLPAGLDLAVVGDAAYADEYIAGLREQSAAIGAELNGRAGASAQGAAAEGELAAAGARAHGPAHRILFTGYQFGDAYRALAQHCALFVIPTEVGGTHPVLVEAMAAGACVVVNDHEPNMETLGDAGAGYPGAEGAPALARVIAELLDDPPRRQELRVCAAERARRLYSWDAVTDAYERLARDLVGSRKTAPPGSVHRTRVAALRRA